MNASVKTRLLEFIKMWTIVENIVFGVLVLSAILFFIGFAIYSAPHNVKF